MISGGELCRTVCSFGVFEVIWVFVCQQLVTDRRAQREKEREDMRKKREDEARRARSVSRLRSHSKSVERSRDKDRERRRRSRSRESSRRKKRLVHKIRVSCGYSNVLNVAVEWAFIIPPIPLM